MKRTAAAAILMAVICPVASAAVIAASHSGSAMIGTEIDSRPLVTEPAAQRTTEAVKPALLHMDWFISGTKTTSWSWVRPHAGPETRLPTTFANVPAPGAAAIIGLAGLIVSRRRIAA